MMFWSDHDMNGWGYAGMATGMVLFRTLIVVGIVALIRYTTGGIQTRVGSAPALYSEYHTPEEMLASSFARGEIDETEYRHPLEILRAAADH